MMPVVVVFGGTGELGAAVVRAAAHVYSNIEIIATYYHSNPLSDCPNVQWTQLDLSDYTAVDSFFNEIYGLVGVLYCAVPKHGGAASAENVKVYTGVVDDVVHAAKATWKKGGKFLAMSTDQVYNGIPSIESTSYDEECPVTPCNYYGRAKVDMEIALLREGKGHPLIICRTSLILTTKPRYGKAIQFVVNALHSQGQKVTLFTDEPRNMSFSDDLALAMLELVLEDRKHWGILNLASSEVTNRYNLAQLICTHLKEGTMDNIQTGLSAESGLNRPLNLALNTSKAQSILKTKIRGISEYFATV